MAQPQGCLLESSGSAGGLVCAHEKCDVNGLPVTIPSGGKWSVHMPPLSSHRYGVGEAATPSSSGEPGLTCVPQWREANG